MIRRVSLHAAFWLTYLALKTYMGVFLINYSWFELEMESRILKSLMPELVVLIPKMMMAYFIMYVILPVYLRRSKTWVTGYLSGITLLSFVVYHLLWKYVLFGILFRESPPQSSFSGDLSRQIWRLLDILSVVGVACAIKLLRWQAGEARRQQQLMQEKLQSEIRFLRAQTNPHFLFNTLNGIYALARKQSLQTPDAVLQLSKLLRYMIYECSEPSVTTGQEWKVIEDYVSLEKLRYADRVDVSLIQEGISGEEKIAPLLLLPLVENAFKHGAGNSSKQTRISVKMGKSAKGLEFTVENTVADHQEHELSRGIGLLNTKRQLDLLYPGHEFSAARENGLFKTYLSINPDCREAESTDR